MSLYLLFHEGGGSRHQHADYKEKKPCELDQSVLHSITFFFYKIEAHRGDRIGDCID